MPYLNTKYGVFKVFCEESKIKKEHYTDINNTGHG